MAPAWRVFELLAVGCGGVGPACGEHCVRQARSTARAAQSVRERERARSDARAKRRAQRAWHGACSCSGRRSQVPPSIKVLCRPPAWLQEMAGATEREKAGTNSRAPLFFASPLCQHPSMYTLAFSKIKLIAAPDILHDRFSGFWGPPKAVVGEGVLLAQLGDLEVDWSAASAPLDRANERGWQTEKVLPI